MESGLLSVSPSPLWTHFVRFDVTRTFYPHFAATLSRIYSAREFAAQLALLMRQWRKKHWDSIFISKDRGRGASRRKEEDEKEETVRQQRGVAMYYESVRVQRLMDAVLFPPGDVQSRLRRGLLRVLDEVWRGAGPGGRDFLLPVAEEDAPSYYRVVKQPISVATMYCSVWDAEIDSFTALKECWVLLRSNCERYNKSGSIMMERCNEVVKLGNNATRDVKSGENCEAGSEWSLPALTIGDLEAIFPPRLEAAAVREESATNGKHTELRRVLRLRQQPVEEKQAVPATGERRRTLSLSTLALSARNGKQSNIDNATPSTRKAATKGGKSINKEEENEEGLLTVKEEKVDNQVQCTRCGTWRLPQGDIPTVPENWICSNIGMTCENVEQTAEKKKRGRQPLSRKEEAEEMKSKKANSQTRNKRTRDQLSNNRSTSQVTSQPPKRKPRTTKSDSSVDSSSSADSSDSSDSRSSSSSDVDTDDDRSARRPRGRGTSSTTTKPKGKRSGKAQATETATTTATDRKNAKAKEVAKPVEPALELEKLIELEAEMDKLEAAPVQKNPHEILRNLKRIEKALSSTKK